MDVEVITVPAAFWLIFLFMLGACTGSFLNVVVYRMPLGLSLVRPGSHCPSCKKPIPWYDNIPVLAWFYLRGRCRQCGTRFSFRYPFVEFLTGILFAGLYWAYFVEGIRGGDWLPPFEQGGWLVYLGHTLLISVMLAGSLIDGEHWIIPLSLSYFAAATGGVLSLLAPYVLDDAGKDLWRLMPCASGKTAAAAAGAGIGLLIGWICLRTGVLKRSFAEWEEKEAQWEAAHGKIPEIGEDLEVNIRLEMLREIAFLAPAVALSAIFVYVLSGDSRFAVSWTALLESQKWLAGLLGSGFGFLVGGAVVWGTRILGSLAFGREAMGLGDVPLMAGVGALLGWISPLVAFFIAPFFGLSWAIVRLITRRSREIPYGPFLSAATVVTMLFHDSIVAYFRNALFPPNMP